MISGTLASIFYLTSAGQQWFQLKKGQSSLRLWVLTAGFLGLALHGAATFELLFTDQGVQLGFFSVASLIMLMIAAFALFSSLSFHLENLLVAVLPITSIALVLNLIFGDQTPAISLQSGGLAAHIVLSILAYSVLLLSAFQGLLLILQDQHLRNRNVDGLVKSLPPLQTMDHLMLFMTLTGFVLLTCAIVIGFFHVEDFFEQQLVHKTALSLISWILFSLILIGRIAFGWRGTQAAKWTLYSVAILALGFMGSKIVIEIILN